MTVNTALVVALLVVVAVLRLVEASMPYELYAKSMRFAFVRFCFAGINFFSRQIVSTVMNSLYCITVQKTFEIVIVLGAPLNR